ncbi:hypothetical protein QR680_000750 [Steinernema hermaphroditum]|uniref:Uncharacterized protein n=1 Tax=Steinernema hermaphroditum TaxID=289476 RepID=A0AA39GVW3_9BILA|nr:hypothetical protein QR680_000750 [Steinernema hermaphroditum]
MAYELRSSQYGINSKDMIKMIIGFFEVLLESHGSLTLHGEQLVKKTFELMQGTSDESKLSLEVLRWEQENRDLVNRLEEMNEANRRLMQECCYDEIVASDLNDQLNEVADQNELLNCEAQRLRKKLEKIEVAFVKQGRTLLKAEQTNVNFEYMLTQANLAVRDAENFAILAQAGYEESLERLNAQLAKARREAREATSFQRYLVKKVEDLEEENKKLLYSIQHINLNEGQQKQEKQTSQAQCSDEDLFEMMSRQFKSETICMIHDFKQHYGKPGTYLTMTPIIQ